MTYHADDEDWKILFSTLRSHISAAQARDEIPAGAEPRGAVTVALVKRIQKLAEAAASGKLVSPSKNTAYAGLYHALTLPIPLQPGHGEVRCTNPHALAQDVAESLQYLYEWKKDRA